MLAKAYRHIKPGLLSLREQAVKRRPAATHGSIHCPAGIQLLFHGLQHRVQIKYRAFKVIADMLPPIRNGNLVYLPEVEACPGRHYIPEGIGGTYVDVRADNLDTVGGEIQGHRLQQFTPACGKGRLVVDKKTGNRCLAAMRMP